MTSARERAREILDCLRIPPDTESVAARRKRAPEGERERTRARAEHFRPGRLCLHTHTLGRGARERERENACTSLQQLSLTRLGFGRVRARGEEDALTRAFSFSFIRCNGSYLHSFCLSFSSFPRTKREGKERSLEIRCG